MIVERYGCGPMQYVEGTGGEDDWCIYETDAQDNVFSLRVYGGLEKDDAERMVHLLNLGAAAEATLKAAKEIPDDPDLVGVLLDMHAQKIKAFEHAMWLRDSGQGEGDEADQHEGRANDLFRAAKANVLSALARTHDAK